MGCRVGVASLGCGDGDAVIRPGMFSAGSLDVDLKRLSLFVIPAVTVGTVAGAVRMGSAGISIVCAGWGRVRFIDFPLFSSFVAAGAGHGPTGWSLVVQ